VWLIKYSNKLKWISFWANFFKIDYITLHVRDLNTSRRFYKSHFGFSDFYKQVTASGIEIYYMKLGDTILELVGGMT
jgi:catechol-2,3-dioxygenase